MLYEMSHQVRMLGRASGAWLKAAAQQLVRWADQLGAKVTRSAREGHRQRARLVPQREGTPPRPYRVAARR
jgi:hypothetical protein